jgi:hypothetical protein
VEISWWLAAGVCVVSGALCFWWGYLLGRRRRPPQRFRVHLRRR